MKSAALTLEPEPRNLRPDKSARLRERWHRSRATKRAFATRGPAPSPDNVLVGAHHRITVENMETEILARNQMNHVNVSQEKKHIATQLYSRGNVVKYIQYMRVVSHIQAQRRMAVGHIPSCTARVCTAQPRQCTHPTISKQTGHSKSFRSDGGSTSARRCTGIHVVASSEDGAALP